MNASSFFASTAVAGLRRIRSYPVQKLNSTGCFEQIPWALGIKTKEKKSSLEQNQESRQEKVKSSVKSASWSPVLGWWSLVLVGLVQVCAACPLPNDPLCALDAIKHCPVGPPSCSPAPRDMAAMTAAAAVARALSADELACSLKLHSVPRLHIVQIVGLPTSAAFCNSRTLAVGLPTGEADLVGQVVPVESWVGGLPPFQDFTSTWHWLVDGSLQQLWKDAFLHLRTCLGILLCMCSDTIFQFVLSLKQGSRTKTAETEKASKPSVVGAQECDVPEPQRLKVARRCRRLPRVCRIRRCRFLGSCGCLGKGSGRRVKSARMRYRLKARHLWYRRLHYWQQGRLPFRGCVPAAHSDAEPATDTAVTREEVGDAPKRLPGCCGVGLKSLLGLAVVFLDGDVGQLSLWIRRHCP